MKSLVTHFASVRLSDLESMLIDDGVDTRDKWRREDNFPLKDSASLRMRDDLSLDMMTVRSESGGTCRLVVECS